PLRWRRIRRAERRRRERRAWEAGGGDHTAVDQVDRRRRRQRTRAVELGVARAKGVAEPAGVDEGHRHLPRLPPEAEVDLAAEAHALGREALGGERGTELGLERGEAGGELGAVGRQRPEDRARRLPAV